jgi:hypothetical protein
MPIPLSRVQAAAAAIANLRAGRRGAPAIANVLELLQSSPRLKHLYDEIMEDAEAALEAAEAEKHGGA